MFFSLELLGRKNTVIISDIIFAIGAIMTTAANGQLGLLYAGRLLSGLGVGGIAAVCPIYVVRPFEHGWRKDFADSSACV